MHCVCTTAGQLSTLGPRGAPSCTLGPLIATLTRASARRQRAGLLSPQNSWISDASVAQTSCLPVWSRIVDESGRNAHWAQATVRSTCVRVYASRDPLAMRTIFCWLALALASEVTPVQKVPLPFFLVIRSEPRIYRFVNMI